MGSTLVPFLLEKGHAVKALDNISFGGASLLGVWSHPKFEFIQADIRDQRAVENALEDIDAVVHLAAIVGDPACAKAPELADSVNRGGSLLLFQQSQKANVKRFVFASTCSNYGRMNNPNKYADERSDLNPLSLYTRTKVDVEQAILRSASMTGICSTVLRFATVYGVSPRMRFDLTVNEFTLQLLTEKRLVVFGEQFWRPYVHVRDIAGAIALVLNSDVKIINNETFNVGNTEQNYTKAQLVELIKGHLKDPVEISYVKKEEDPRDYRVSFEKIEKKLGFRTTRTVKEGISEIIRALQSDIF